MQATRSVAECLRNALKYCSGSFLCSRARRETIYASSLLNPFIRQERSEIGEYPLYVVFGLPGLGMMVTSALLNGSGW